MKWQVALVFISLFLLVGSFCLWIETPFSDKELVQSPAAAQPKKEPEPVQETFSAHVMDLLPEDAIAWIQIQNLDERKTLTLIAAEDGAPWRIKFPVQDDANAAKVEELIQALLSTQKLQPMNPEKSWEEYGLARPKIKIGIETVKSPARRYLYLGAASPVGNVLFARWEDEKSYFLLPLSFEELFLQSVYNFRDKKIFAGAAGSVRRLELETASGHYEIENQGAQWVWKEPEAMRWSPCPAGDAEALLEHLRGLFVKDFLEKSAPEESGLAQGMKIRLWTDENHAETLHLGKEAVVRDAYYARKGEDGGTVLIAREKVNAFLDLFRALAAEKALGPSEASAAASADSAGP